MVVYQTAVFFCFAILFLASVTSVYAKLWGGSVTTSSVGIESLRISFIWCLSFSVTPLYPHAIILLTYPFPTLSHFCTFVPLPISLSFSVHYRHYYRHGNPPISTPQLHNISPSVVELFSSFSIFAILHTLAGDHLSPHCFLVLYHGSILWCGKV